MSEADDQRSGVGANAPKGLEQSGVADRLQTWVVSEAASVPASGQAAWKLLCNFLIFLKDAVRCVGQMLEIRQLREAVVGDKRAQFRKRALIK